jgi:hypothetical protein
VDGRIRASPERERVSGNLTIGVNLNIIVILKSGERRAVEQIYAARPYWRQT